MKRGKKWMLAGLFCLAAIFIFLYGLNRGLTREKGNAGDFLASVGDQTITAERFIREMTRRPGNFHPEELKETLLEDMIQSNLLYAAALKAGYDKDPAVVDAIRHVVPEKYRSEHLVPLLNQIKITDEELEQYYQSHPSEFQTKKMRRAAVIQISIPQNASSEKKARLFERAVSARKEALKLNPNTRSFGSIAVKYSDHQPTRYRGGDTGWLQKNRRDLRWPKEVMEAIFALQEPMKISPVIATPEGYYLVKLIETKESRLRPLSAVKNRIRHQLIHEKKVEVERKFYGELKNRVHIKVNRARLKAIEPPTGGSGKKPKSPPALPGQ